MIGKLSGMVDSIQGQTLILDVQGVGYVVQVGMRTLAAIEGEGQAAALAIETIVREDAITLYGFADMAEQAWFRTLTTVQGVGPKVALSILSACTPDQLALAIGARDSTLLTRADGVGPKLATRIVMELKDKPPHIPLGTTHANRATTRRLTPDNQNTPAATPSAKTSAKKAATTSKVPASTADTPPSTEDAVSALVNLGYGRAEAYQAVAAVLGTGTGGSLSQLITAALKELAA